MENETRRKTPFFNKKTRKTRKNRNNKGKNTKKQEKKCFKKNLENYKKYRNETRQDFGETRFPRDKILNRFREMLKTETRTKKRSSRMSQNDNSRAWRASSKDYFWGRVERKGRGSVWQLPLFSEGIVTNKQCTAHLLYSIQSDVHISLAAAVSYIRHLARITNGLSVV